MTPLVKAVLWLGLGILIGTQGPAPTRSGPLLLLVALSGVVAACCLMARPGGRSPGGRSPGRALAGVARERTARRLLPLLFLLAGALLGAGSRTAAERSCRALLPEDRAVRLSGTVEDVGQGGRSIRLSLQALRMAGPEWEVECAGAVPARWQASGRAPPGRGDRVTVVGRWWSPPGTGRGLRRAGTLLVDSLSLEGSAGRALPTEALRTGLLRRIEVLYPRHAALVASLLLAERDGLDPSVREQYARAGLSHLLAISGLHVGLVSGMLVLLLGALRLPRRLGAGAAAAGTAGYVAFLGAPHSAVRAALQIILALSARVLQRPTRTGSVVAAAALALLAVQPAALLQAGFQLSFAGVAGILALRPPLLRALEPLDRLRVAGRSPGGWFRDALATSIAATVATAPIVVWHFGRVAPIGVAANLLGIPLLGFAVPGLALSLALAPLSHDAAAFVAGGAAALLDALNAVASTSANVPGGSVAVAPSSAVVGLTACAAAYAFSRRLGRVRPTIRTATAAASAAAVLLLAPLRIPSDRVEIHMIDVGQGDAIAIRSPAGRWLLVDAGIATDSYDAGAARVVPYLAGRGVTRLEALIITHPDADHMGGAAAVAEALRPRWIGDPGIAAGKPGYLELLRASTRRGIPWIGLHTGVQLEIDGALLEVLYPGADVLAAPPEDANDASVILRLEYGEFSVLLTGDAPMAVEQVLARTLGTGLEAEVLKVGHHGSRTSTSAELLAAAGPRHALVSAGIGNRYGHPHGDVLARLAGEGVRIHRTDRHGSVTVHGDAAGRIRITREKGAPE